MTTSDTPLVAESDIKDFWNAHPCGDALVGGLNDGFHDDYRAFFDEYDRWRYSLESHIPECLDALGVDGQRVLEIGLGQGADSEQLIRRGARWSGLDLTEEAVERVRTRMTVRGLAFDEIKRGSVLDIPYGADQFDLVFSHGVLHHVPDVIQAQAEIHRVLKPEGRLVVMLYARSSLNYQVAIRIVRRVAILAAWPLRHRVPDGALKVHLTKAAEEGLSTYLRLERFTHASTDGPENPYARVYDLDDVARDFPQFAIVKSHQHFMHAPPLPVHRLPGGTKMGWHLWVEMVPREQ